MTKILKIIVIGILVFLLSSCANNAIQKEDKNDDKLLCKQESTKAKDWVASWRTCSGDGAIKKDGTLWKFGKVGGCSWGQMFPFDQDTAYTMSYIYHLEPKKIGDGFGGAKIINGGYRVYAIKKDGTLWGWGEGLGKKAMLLSHSHDWVDVGIYPEGHDCAAREAALKKDGSLWTVTELFDHASKRPKVGLSSATKQKGWDKVILSYYNSYAMKKDGSLWINCKAYPYVSNTRYVKYDSEHRCGVGEKISSEKIRSKFRQVPSHTIVNYEMNNPEKFRAAGSAGILCVKPEVKYKFK